MPFLRIVRRLRALLWALAFPAAVSAQTADLNRIAADLVAPLRLTPAFGQPLTRAIVRWLTSSSDAARHGPVGLACSTTIATARLVTLNGDRVPEVLLQARGPCVAPSGRGMSWIFARRATDSAWVPIASESGAFWPLRSRSAGYMDLQSAPGSAVVTWRWNGREYRDLCMGSSFSGDTCRGLRTAQSASDSLLPFPGAPVLSAAADRNHPPFDTLLVAARLLEPLPLSPYIRPQVIPVVAALFRPFANGAGRKFPSSISCAGIGLSASLRDLNRDTIPEIIVSTDSSCDERPDTDSWTLARDPATGIWRTVSRLGDGVQPLTSRRDGYVDLLLPPTSYSPAQPVWRWNGRGYDVLCVLNAPGSPACPSDLGKPDGPSGLPRFVAQAPAPALGPPPVMGPPIEPFLKAREAAAALTLWQARVGLTSDAAAETGFAQYIERIGGTVPGSVREMWANQGAATGHVWLELPMSRTLGHGHLGINSLGKMPFSPREAMALVRRDLPAVFPTMGFVGAAGWNGPNVEIGHVFLLPPYGFTVGVTADQAYSFALSTFYWHVFNGTATHGIFQDATGELWMFQEGYGPPGGILAALTFGGETAVSLGTDFFRTPFESGCQATSGTSCVDLARQMVNNWQAEKMWREMAENTARMLAANARPQ